MTLRLAALYFTPFQLSLPARQRMTQKKIAVGLDSVAGYRVYNVSMRSERVLREGAAKAGLRIGEVAERSGVGVETLRFYERRGLLGRPRRTPAGYRLYDEAALERLAFIKRAQAIGFSLDEIGEILTESAGGRSPCRRVREMARSKLVELDARLRELRRHRNELAATLQDWDERGEEEGHICGLIEHSKLSAPPATSAKLKRRARKGE